MRLGVAEGAWLGVEVGSGVPVVGAKLVVGAIEGMDVVTKVEAVGSQSGKPSKAVKIKDTI